MDISFRLQQISDMVTAGHRVADIGTDHGYVPIKLVLENRIPSALAMDVREGPLQRAREHVLRYGLEDKIQLRLSDGLEQLDAEEADTIVIAGMGGDLMTKILQAQEMRFLQNKEWILQPQSEPEKVRRQMHAMGYQIAEERFFMDEGKYYVCMKLVPGQEHYEKECEYIYGRYLLEQNNSVLLQYLHLKQNLYLQIKEQIYSNNKRRELTYVNEQKIKEIDEKLEILSQAFAYYK